MMSEIITIEQASVCFTDLIHLLRTNDEIVITENQMPIARILRTQGICPPAEPAAADPGLASINSDSNHLAFKDYMP